MRERGFSLPRFLTVTVAVSAAAAVAAGTATAAKTVRTVGGPGFKPNQFIIDTVRFSPGPLRVRSGERVTWIDRDRVPEPHTVTVATRQNIPNTLQELFRCQVCELATGHLEDPQNPESDVRTLVLNAGAPGLDRQGDSLFLVPGGRISARISAPAGSTVRYLCAIHPWMQGSLRVVAGGGAALSGRHH